jgi:serine/threonine-protein kinase PpkA
MTAAARYRLERELARGRHASVWLAADLERREAVALKIAPRESLQREFETLRALEHEHIVKARDAGVLPDGRPFIAMERLQPARAPWPHRLHGAALALAHMHGKGWVHRDVKPAHLLSRDDGDVVLCDMGSACRVGAREPFTATSVIGTPRYAAPEQTEGAAASPAADVYSLGVCAFEFITGQPPFRGETLTELFSQHVRAPVPRLPGEAAHWQAFIEALLAKDPARRPHDGRAVLAQLESLTGAAVS